MVCFLFFWSTTTTVISWIEDHEMLETAFFFFFLFGFLFFMDFMLLGPVYCNRYKT